MARIHADSPLYGEPWLCASELKFEAKEALILRAAPLDESRLQSDFPERFIEQDHVRWDDKQNALIARREVRFDQIVLSSKSAGKVDPEQAAEALCARGPAERPGTPAMERQRCSSSGNASPVCASGCLNLSCPMLRTKA